MKSLHVSSVLQSHIYKNFTFMISGFILRTKTSSLVILIGYRLVFLLSCKFVNDFVTVNGYSCYFNATLCCKILQSKLIKMETMAFIVALFIGNFINYIIIRGFTGL